jgi:hypothetical protein
MKGISVIIFGFLLAFSSCENAETVPDEILPDSIMTDILVEIKN